MTYELTNLLYGAINHVDNSVWISQAVILFCSSVYFIHISNRVHNASRKLDEILKEIKNWEQVKEEE